MPLFGTKGQKFLHFPETKGQWDKLKILLRDGTWDGMVQDFDSLPRPVPGNKAGQSRKVRSKTGKGCSKTGKGCFKIEIWSFF